MKKNYFIFLLMMLIASGCEKADLHDGDLTTDSDLETSLTRSGVEAAAYSSGFSLFKNIRTQTVYDAASSGTFYMEGEIECLGVGTEYDFILDVTSLRGPGLKIVAWATVGEIYQDGVGVKTCVFGEYGKRQEFTLRFLGPWTKVIFAVEGDIMPSYDQEAIARLVISDIRYNGERVLNNGGTTDLNVWVRYRETNGGGNGGSTEYHWICNQCRTTNSANAPWCVGCGAGGH